MPKARIFLLLVLLFLSIVFRFFFFFQDQSHYKSGQKLEFVTRLTEEPQIVYGKVQFRVKTEKGERITIITGLKPELQYGDRIQISGIITKKDYKGRIFTSIKNPTLQIVNKDQNFVSGTATFIRRRATSFFDENMPEISSKLLNGIVFGGNQGLPRNFLQDLRSSGVVHVIAASGMNVTFMAGALLYIFGAVFKRKIALTIAIFGIIFYAYLSGLEPSIIRASSMSILAFSASFFGRQNLSIVALFITAYIMLFLNPNTINDVGFQLSFLATLGILILKPLIKNKDKNFLIDDLGTTISAQATTLPILLSVFGSYGLLSIVVNGLVLWTVPILMILGSLAVLFSIVFEPIGKVFLFLALPILFFFEKTITFFGNLGWTLTLPPVSPMVWVGYYLIIIAIVIFLQKNIKR